MAAEGAWALLIGEPVGQADVRTRPAELLREIVGEVQSFPTPGDALDAFCSHALHGSLLRSPERNLVVLDQRGREEIQWTWLSLLAHLDFGPVILLVDELDDEIERRSRKCGVRHCLAERHLVRHPGLLVRAARRVLSRSRSLVPVSAAS